MGGARRVVFALILALCFGMTPVTAVASVQAPGTLRLRAHTALDAMDAADRPALAHAEGGSSGPDYRRGGTSPGLRQTERLLALKHEFATSKARFIAQRTALGVKIFGEELAIAAFAASLTASVFVAAMRVWMHKLQNSFSSDTVMHDALTDAVNLVDHIHYELDLCLRDIRAALDEAALTMPDDVSGFSRDHVAELQKVFAKLSQVQDDVRTTQDAQKSPVTEPGSDYESLVKEAGQEVAETVWDEYGEEAVDAASSAAPKGIFESLASAIGIPGVSSDAVGSVGKEVAITAGGDVVKSVASSLAWSAVLGPIGSIISIIQSLHRMYSAYQSVENTKSLLADMAHMARVSAAAETDLLRHEVCSDVRHLHHMLRDFFGALINADGTGKARQAYANLVEVMKKNVNSEEEEDGSVDRALHPDAFAFRNPGFRIARALARIDNVVCTPLRNMYPETEGEPEPIVDMLLASKFLTPAKTELSPSPTSPVPPTPLETEGYRAVPHVGPMKLDADANELNPHETSWPFSTPDADLRTLLGFPSQDKKERSRTLLVRRNKAGPDCQSKFGLQSLHLVVREGGTESAPSAIAGSAETFLAREHNVVRFVSDKGLIPPDCGLESCSKTTRRANDLNYGREKSAEKEGSLYEAYLYARSGPADTAIREVGVTYGINTAPGRSLYVMGQINGYGDLSSCDISAEREPTRFEDPAVTEPDARATSGQQVLTPAADGPAVNPLSAAAGHAALSYAPIQRPTRAALCVFEAPEAGVWDAILGRASGVDVFADSKVRAAIPAAASGGASPSLRATTWVRVALTTNYHVAAEAVNYKVTPFLWYRRSLSVPPLADSIPVDGSTFVDELYLDVGDMLFASSRVARHAGFEPLIEPACRRDRGTPGLMAGTLPDREPSFPVKPGSTAGRWLVLTDPAADSAEQATFETDGHGNFWWHRGPLAATAEVTEVAATGSSYVDWVVASHYAFSGDTLVKQDTCSAKSPGTQPGRYVHPGQAAAISDTTVTAVAHACGRRHVGNARWEIDSAGTRHLLVEHDKPRPRAARAGWTGDTPTCIPVGKTESGTPLRAEVATYCKLSGVVKWNLGPRKGEAVDWATADAIDPSTLELWQQDAVQPFVLRAPGTVLGREIVGREQGSAGMRSMMITEAVYERTVPATLEDPGTYYDIMTGESVVWDSEPAPIMGTKRDRVIFGTGPDKKPLNPTNAVFEVDKGGHYYFLQGGSAGELVALKGFCNYEPEQLGSKKLPNPGTWYNQPLKIDQQNWVVCGPGTMRGRFIIHSPAEQDVGIHKAVLEANRQGTIWVVRIPDEVKMTATLKPGDVVPPEQLHHFLPFA